MATRTQSTKGPRPTIATRNSIRTAPSARSRKVINKGINSSSDFKTVMSALISDVIDGKVVPQVVNAACNAGGKLLKVVDMELRYGGGRKGGKPAVLALTA